MTVDDGSLAVGFDFGGTLAPRLSPLLDRLWSEEFAALLGQEAAQKVKEEFRGQEAAYWISPDRVVQPSMQLAANALEQALPTTAAEALVLASRVEGTVRRRFAAEVAVQEGTSELLRWLSGYGLRIGVLSNFIFPSSTVRDWLAVHDLARYFKAVLTNNEIGFSKPAPEAFQSLMKALGTRTPSQLLYVGNDWVEDVQGAVAAGCRAVYVAGTDPRGKPPHDELRIPEVHDVSQLRGVIEAML
jgi:HAD superfamily hydrolase (TIGR01549 family)